MKFNKYIIASAVIMSIYSSAYAYDASEYCAVQETMATTTMNARQSGVPISKTLAIANSIKDEDMKELANILVNWAYSKHRFTSEEYRKNAAVDFGTEVYNTCMNAIKKSKK